MIETPNPGSREAGAAGCICPVLDNCHGRFAPWPPDGWYIVEGCPVHSLEVDGSVPSRETNAPKETG